MLYLSMLVIPIQGFAASTMLFCGPAHQHTVAAQAADHHSARGDAHYSSADRKSLNHAGVVGDSARRAATGEAPDLTSSDHGAAKSGDTGAHEGSEHAACFVGAAVPASSPKFATSEPVSERFASQQFLNIGFVTDGPIRPPRSFPA